MRGAGLLLSLLDRGVHSRSVPVHSNATNSSSSVDNDANRAGRTDSIRRSGCYSQYVR